MGCCKDKTGDSVSGIQDHEEQGCSMRSLFFLGGVYEYIK